MQTHNAVSGEGASRVTALGAEANMEMVMQKIKDEGIGQIVMDSYPYAVVGGAYEGSLPSPIAAGAWITLLNHIVPHGQQLKMLFLRVWTDNAAGARFAIVQTNPAAAGLTGTVEAYPVVGNTPPFTNGAIATRDYPFLEAAGAEVLRGGLRDPVHVLEGSIDIRLLGPTVIPPGATRYSVAWWGYQKIPN